MKKIKLIRFIISIFSILYQNVISKVAKTIIDAPVNVSIRSLIDLLSSSSLKLIVKASVL